jgi:thermopsin
MRQAGVFALVTMMAVGSLGLLGAVVGGVAAPASGANLAAPSPHASVASTTSSPTVATTTVATSSSTTNRAEAMANAALTATRAAGLKPNVVFVPRPSATPQQVAAARQQGTITPLYSGSPAPMGLADYGLSAGPGGTVVGSILNTTSLVATVNMNSTGVQAADLFQSSPDSYGIQLNAVVTNVTLFGTPGYSFWTQNVVEYYPQTDFLVLVTNVWNFSGGPLSANVFYQHGPLGVQVGTEYYYAEHYISTPVVYPFNLTLFLNSTAWDGRNAVNFTVQLGSSAYPAENFTAPYDYVIFNSNVTGVPSTVKKTPSNYTANGLSYNPMGLTDDFELIFGGPGGGSQATLFDADATLGLGYWDGTAYVSVPSAYSYGGETGETVTGANVAWSSAASGVPYPGLATYGTMTTGPSILTGLWNAGAPQGSYPVTLDVQPANAFNVFATSTGWSSNFTVSELAVAPELFTNVVNLIPGNYTLETELSDYAPVVTQLDVNGPMTVTLSLTPNTAFGVYTPLWAFSNSEIAAISSSGTGTSTSPYVIVNNQYGVIGSEFGLYNDWGFPVYPAVFLYGTTATTVFNHPPSFATATSTFQFPGQYLPATNDLQYWFWNVTHVAIIGASSISGWFAASAFYPTSFDTFSVIFYEGGHNLVARNTFDSEGQGLLMFSGGTIFGPLNVGGGYNTVWNNSFFEVPTPSSVISLLPGAFGLAMEIAESNDVIYNNYVDTPTTAWLLPLNIYSGDPEFFTDAFNISEQPAINIHYAAGFPFEPLTGSIIGTSYQGGNFWWDYGLAFNPYNGANNPYGVLPYDENAPTLLVDVYGPSFYYATYIYPGGDYVPLIPFTLYPVTFQEHSFTPALGWGAEVYQGAAILDVNTTTASSFAVYLPVGLYEYAVIAPAGWTGSSSVPFMVLAAPTTVTVSFQLTFPVTVKEKGLATGLTWGAQVYQGQTLVTTFTTGASNYVVNLTNGTYTLSAIAPSGWTGPSSEVVKVLGRATTVTLSFKVAKGDVSLTFSESGLVKNTEWTVTLNGTSPTTYAFNATETTTGTSLVFAVAKGDYTYTITPIGGYKVIPWSSPFIVTANTIVHLRFTVVTYTVTFTETGLPTGKTWSVMVDGKTRSSRGSSIVFSLANGTYTYTVRAPSGYAASPTSGSVTVDAHSASVAVTFVRR